MVISVFGMFIIKNKGKKVVKLKRFLHSFLSRTFLPCYSDIKTAIQNVIFCDEVDMVSRDLYKVYKQRDSL